MDPQRLAQMAIKAIKTTLEYLDDIDGTLCAAHETIIMNEVARLYPLHLHAEDPDVAYLQIAYDAAVTIVEELNRAEPEPECRIQPKWFYQVVQLLLAIHLKPVLVEGPVPRIDEEANQGAAQIDGEDVGKGAEEQGVSDDDNDGPSPPLPGPSARADSEQPVSPSVAVSPGPANQDDALKKSPWTDQEIRTMIRKRVVGWKHPRIATYLGRSLSGVQQQWRRALLVPEYQAYEAECRAALAADGGDDEE